MTYRMSSSWTRAVVTLTLAAAAAAPALAYNYETCSGQRRVWGSSTVTLRPANISFPGSYRTALEETLNGWNYRTPGTKFRYTHVYTDSTTWQEGDGVNTVGFAANWTWDPNFIAVSLWRYNACYWFGGGTLKEVDIMFNNNYFFNTTISPYALPSTSDTWYNLTITGLHEYGHGFGLQHQQSMLATMNSVYPFGGVLGNNNDLHPHADDVHGDRAGYGACCTERDLAVSAYARTGAGTSNLIAAPAYAYRGNPASFQFTISNRGTVNETSARVEFYLSTDRFVTTSDIYLGAATYNLNAGAEGTYWATPTIPSWLTPGTYYFGYVIDPLGSVPEINETNNGVGYASPTQVPSYSPPVSCFSANPTYGNTPLGVSFDGSCSSDPDGSVVSYSWNFGDGATDSGPTAYHTYWSPGFYTVTLTVTDNSGYTSQSYQYIDVYEEPCPGCPVF